MREKVPRGLYVLSNSGVPTEIRQSNILNMVLQDSLVDPAEQVQNDVVRKLRVRVLQLFEAS